MFELTRNKFELLTDASVMPGDRDARAPLIRIATQEFVRLAKEAWRANKNSRPQNFFACLEGHDVMPGDIMWNVSPSSAMWKAGTWIYPAFLPNPYERYRDQGCKCQIFKIDTGERRKHCCKRMRLACLRELAREKRERRVIQGLVNGALPDELVMKILSFRCLDSEPIVEYDVTTQSSRLDVKIKEAVDECLGMASDTMALRDRMQQAVLQTATFDINSSVLMAGGFGDGDRKLLKDIYHVSLGAKASIPPGEYWQWDLGYDQSLAPALLEHFPVLKSVLIQIDCASGHRWDVSPPRNIQIKTPYGEVVLAGLGKKLVDIAKKLHGQVLKVQVDRFWTNDRYNRKQAYSGPEVTVGENEHGVSEKMKEAFCMHRVGLHPRESR